jgi:hypothetical protein
MCLDFLLRGGGGRGSKRGNGLSISGPPRSPAYDIFCRNEINKIASMRAEYALRTDLYTECLLRFINTHADRLIRAQ